jgi:RimJ/RimL family protein N-acetyltransferase
VKKRPIIKKNLKFRLAAINDADILFEWRNDSETRKSSHNSQKIKPEEHIEWLKASLNNSNRKIFIVEYNGDLVGTIRTDYLNGDCLLSWTVAPKARGRGIGKEMVALFAHRITGRIRAEVKTSNEASKLIAEYAGMEFSCEKDGIIYYTRLAIIV